MNGLEKAVYIAKHLEDNLPETMHVGLTGGTLYKEGERKDIDFVVYSHKCFQLIDTNNLANMLNKIGFTNLQNFGRVIKGTFKVLDENVDVDVIVPESQSGEYVEEPQ